MNRCIIKDDIIYFQPFDGEEIEVCGIEEINIVDGKFVYGNQCYPLDERFLEEKIILDMWNKLYPNGKVEEVVGVVRVVTDEEKATDMMKLIAISVMNDDTLLKTFGITPRPIL
jgi:hypothetical protein